MEKIDLTVTGETKQIILREGAAPNLFVYDGFHYAAESTESLITLTKSKGNKPNVIVAYDQSGIKVILDDQIVDRSKDRISYEFKRSRQFKEWQNILMKGQVFDQKSLIDFLRRREEGEIIEVESLLAAIQNFKFVTNISGDFTYDDRNNYTFAIKIGDSEGTVKLPKYIFAFIELYNESNFKQSIEIEVEVQKPRGEGEKPMFLISCPKFARYDEEALKNEVDTIKKGLEGYLVVAGRI